jgi:hypothetical protein
VLYLDALEDFGVFILVLPKAARADTHIISHLLMLPILKSEKNPGAARN